jgi:hypothetical protein
MDLRKYVVRWGLARTARGAHPMVSFGISGVKPSDSTTTELLSYTSNNTVFKKNLLLLPEPVAG